jgi:hypothetical protein
VPKTKTIQRARRTKAKQSKFFLSRGISSFPRLVGAAAFVLVFATIGTAYVLNSHATNIGPGEIICNTSKLCFNAKQGGTTAGTPVIGYTNDDDSNEAFDVIYLAGMCDNGTVTSTCPFTVGSGLNNRYIHDDIVAIKDYGDKKNNLCIGNDTQNRETENGALETCPNIYGQNGGQGTIFIHNIYGGGGTINYVESLFWSNYNKSLGINNAPSWLCSNGNRGQLTTYTDDFYGQCQWQILNP